ncbi:ParB N-terminal domain-containing protein [Dyella jejuensis]|uniref:ParB N-terminal domain-containing protein n=1 Tax=Dyella jejuensis TaxID=1432009 RepID=A0ABW8JNY2_9GAMM
MKRMEINSPDAPKNTRAIKTMSNGYVVKLLPLGELRPHEEHDHDSALQLSRLMAMDGYVSRPVVVEERTLTLLDGHHRVAALTILGCKFVPSVLLSYEDPRVYLDGWRSDVAVDRDMVLAAASRGYLLPKKTTRHQLSPDLDQIKVELALLNSD